MIKIADNPIVRGQVKKAAPEAGAPGEAVARDTPPPDPPTYPAKSLVLDGGRYYASKTEK